MKHPSPILAFTFISLIAQTTAPAPDPYTLSPEAFFKPPPAKEHIAKDSADIPLLEAAIFHATNQARIAQKLPPFQHSFKLTLAARRHSEEMAKLQYFSHD